jgi:Phage integrase, N-terminal SAM-like domain
MGITLIDCSNGETSQDNYLLYGNFLDIMENKCNIKNFSGYHSVEKPTKKLFERVSDVIRLKHYSYKTEKGYVNWIKHYIIFHNKSHLREIGYL